MNSRKFACFGAGLVALVLLGAGQPPGATPPPAPAPAIPPTGGPEAIPPLAVPVAQPSPTSDPANRVPVQPPVRQFNFKIDPKASAKDLLPPPPKGSAIRGPVTTDDLKAIPEVEFAARPAKDTKHEKLLHDAAYQIAKINHVNGKKTDAFMAALVEHRPDLAGMPFAMGDACRTTGDKLKYFAQAAQLVRQAMAGNVVPPNAPSGQPGQAPSPSFRGTAPVQPVSAVLVGDSPPASGRLTLGNFTAVQTESFFIVQQPFWKRYAELCEQEDTARERTDKDIAEHVTVARVSALCQMLAAEPAEVRLGLVKHLTGVPHVEATKALARMAIYSAEADIRSAALTALKVRREKDYTDVLVSGLRYPWPAVAKHAAEAIARLERTDLIPELLNVLDATDPRLPVVKDEDGKKVAAVREMVKLNHHRNCLMCHAPAGSGTPNPNAPTAEVALQTQPLPQPFEGYRQSTPEIMVRLDVTYLRHDFSVAMPVADAHPWPETQRFDFFVRERKLTADEAAEYREKLTPKEEGVLSPYHKAAVAALRELTGKDAAPTAAAWRKLLGK